MVGIKLGRQWALLLLLVPISLTLGGTTQGPYKVPAGYKFHDFVEFTDERNGGLPHLALHESEGSPDEPSEGWQTLLITPDGKAYTKPISDSLNELLNSPHQAQFLPSQSSRSEERQQTSRKLAQASIGVSTSSDLSCNGCGPDNRVQVTQTTAYPYMTMGQLIGQLGTSAVGLECTGTLIGNRHLVTAAHCVFDINASRKMVSALNFAPAKNGDSDPYGTIEWTQARIVSQFSSQPGYTTTAMNYDFALVTLASEATSGYLGMYFPPSNGETVTVNLTTAGYPGSKPSGTLWSSACGQTKIDYSASNQFANVEQCSNEGCSNILTETCISSDGQSGSAIWDPQYSIRAILTGRVTTSDNLAYNVATEISTEVYNQIASWYNEDGDSAGNGTLPLAPSGPGSQPKQTNDFIKFWTQNWGKGWFIAVVVVIAMVAAVVLFLFFNWLLRCCCAPAAQPVKKPVAGPTAYPAQFGPPAPQPQPSYGGVANGRPGGIDFDPQTGQFMKDGRQYGQYQGHL